MISSSCWVPRGFAAEFPEKYELDDAEMDRITKMAQLELEDAKEDLQEAEKAQNALTLQDQATVDDDLKEYNLENYDNDGQETAGESVGFFPGLSATDAQYEENDEGDAYLSLPTNADLQEDKKEMQIYPTDNLVLATRTEDDVLYLDVYVYDDGAGAPSGSKEEQADRLDQDVANGMTREANLYVHHDLMLPSFPLCVEWVNFRPNAAESTENIGNFAAVGTFEPQIEIWNLDCIDKAFPDVILGEPQQNSFTGLSSKKKKKKSKGKEHVTTHHTDAVLSLAHNKIHRNVLASTSADTTVKLWDLVSGTAVKSFSKIHEGKIVSSSQWHPLEASILLTGGYNGACAVSDVRVSDENQMSKSYYVGSGQEVENVRWGAEPEIFYCGTDNGNVYCFDVRVQDKPLWTLHAHDSGISSLDINRNVPGMLITSAMNEKAVKLWKCPTGKGGPSMVLSRDFGVGNVLTTAFAGDFEVAGNLTIGGVTGALKMWDCFSNRSVRATFKQELSSLQKAARERAVAAGIASRIARKYQGDGSETLMTVEAGKIDADSDSDEEPAGMDEDED
ncbi:periodic tryptophan protein 1 [Metschnikowia bicuspidata var. bicuspidata NRRL YB-4993]|uniref:Periodic tryptophan protein 1 n=1 Tax=Metschnikowia bicuspidata var. bicuspidata NRRL YB-4993 TaxID=869754 RepID=A0A1A0HJC6_9ASCO|nr:periodic tryptophan protein 1 [Metschnikowia bicuspidata var. bicuspidata NRRL YB-4993]OBA24101.1 periodic tryptophan protein 1 [Metschnikowia bicuspidata var. bicuspidata NRRL YB-4993]